MKNREWEILKKAEKNIHDRIEDLFRRQNVINMFFYETLSDSNQILLAEKVKEFDENQDKEKEAKEAIDQMSTIRKNLQPTPKKEV